MPRGTCKGLTFLEGWSFVKRPEQTLLHALCAEALVDAVLFRSRPAVGAARGWRQGASQGRAPRVPGMAVQTLEEAWH